MVNPRALAVSDFHTCAIDDSSVTGWDIGGQTTVPALGLQGLAAVIGGLLGLGLVGLRVRRRGIERAG